MELKEVMVFSHNDLDGVTSPVVLQKCLEVLNPESSYQFTTHHCQTGKYGTIDKEIKKFLNSGEVVNAVYVTDLTPSEEMIKELHDYAAFHGIEFKIYDHHKTALHVNDLFEEACIETNSGNGMKHSATSLIFEKLIGSTPESYIKTYGDVPGIAETAHLASIVRSWDTWDWNNDEKDRWKMQAKRFKQLHDIDGTRAFLKRFTRTAFPTFSDSDSKILAVLEDSETRYIQEKINHSKIGMMTHEGRTYTYAFTCAEQHKSFLGNQMCNIKANGKDVDFAIIFDNGFLSLRAKKLDVDVSVIAEAFFNGGGHQPAAGGKVEFDAINLIKQAFEVVETTMK